MSEPRETLFAAIQAQLEKIKIENGYALTVGRVFRGVDILPEQMNEGDFPALEVLEEIGGERWERVDQQGYVCRLPMIIAGTIRSGTTDLTSVTRHSEINRLLNAVADCLMEDATFGGAGGCRESVLSQPVVFVDPQRGEAFFNLTLTCIYIFGRADL
jgi:hypothetical protein